MEYVTSRIIRQIYNPAKSRYIIRWYEYGEKDNTAEPDDNVPQYLQEAYWRQVHEQHSKNRRKQKLAHLQRKKA